MIKKLLFSLFILIGLVGFTQSKYYTKSAKISFYSEAEDENIEAHNNRVTTIFEHESEQIEFSLLIKAFQFEKALMQEHFNENYMESDKYPKSTFKGKAEGLSHIDLKKDGKHTLMAKGDLTIHGVTQNVETPIVFTVKNGKISSHAEFVVALEDYDVKIPSVVGNKIAENIKIVVDVDEYKAL